MTHRLTPALLSVLCRVRWAYFHIHPGYTKFYVDEAHTEAHFSHARTNTTHCDYEVIRSWPHPSTSSTSTARSPT